MDENDVFEIEGHLENSGFLAEFEGKALIAEVRRLQNENTGMRADFAGLLEAIEGLRECPLCIGRVEAILGETEIGSGRIYCTG